MPPGSKRIPRSDFPIIIKKGKGFHAPYLSLKVLSSAERPSHSSVGPFFAVVVGVKTAKLATDRNLLKRRARAIFKELAPKLKKNYYYLVILKTGVLKLKFSDLRDGLIKAFKDSGLLYL